MTTPALHIRNLSASVLGALLTTLIAPLAFAAAEAAQKAEHPLVPVLKIAEDGLKHIDQNVSGYTATLVKKERIAGELSATQTMFIKVRHKPFSVYMRFFGPKKVKDDEVIFIEGQNDGKLTARAGHGLRRRVGKLSLDPNSPLAMEGHRYPITMLGMRTLVKRLMDVGSQELKYDEITVNITEGAKINGRPCTVIHATHPEPRKHFRYHVARVFVDDELQMPVRFEAYLWPKSSGGRPVVVEQYTYLNIELRDDLTDKDFQPENVNYRFIDKK
ncbi:MAG: DUF1571 domain-containing protein [Planctomycetales bacterium]